MSQHWITNSDRTFDDFLLFAREMQIKHKYMLWQWTTGQQRSALQNNSLHLYCGQLATGLNDAGFDFMQVMNTDALLPWAQPSVKEFLWRPIQKSITGKVSTKRPTREEYPMIYEALNRHIATRWGVSVPWPVKEPATKLPPPVPDRFALRSLL